MFVIMYMFLIYVIVSIGVLRFRRVIIIIIKQTNTVLGQGAAGAGERTAKGGAG